MDYKPVLGIDIARAILDAAIAAARTEQIAVSVAITDEGGYLLGLLRMDGAGLMTAKVAEQKARTAALIRAPSRRLAERLDTEPALLRLTDYLPMAGGLPVLIDGRCAGAIGISGGSADQDERIADAGLAAMGGDGNGPAPVNASPRRRTRSSPRR